MAKDINISKIYFGSGAYARQMRAGMQDIIDLKGLKENTKLYDGVTVGFSDPFDVLMGFKQYYPTDTNHFQYKTPPFYVVPDMNKRCFAIQNDNFLDNPFGSNEICFNYFKAIISYTDGSNTIFYGFVTSQTQMNTANAMLFTFEIDWAHTSQLLYKLNNAIRQPFDIKQAYVARDNKHHITKHYDEIGALYTGEIAVGRGAENVRMFDLQELEAQTPYHPEDCRMLPDDEMRFVKVTFSKDNTTFKFNNNDITLAQMQAGYNGLYSVFMPLFKASDGRAIIFYYNNTAAEADLIGATAFSPRYTFDLLHAIALCPDTVSIELVNEMPCIKKVQRGTVDNFDVVNVIFDNVSVIMNGKTPGTPPLFAIDTISGYGLTPKSKSTFMPFTPASASVLEFYNAPKQTCLFRTYAQAEGQSAVIKGDGYNHEEKRSDEPFEPKLAQPQFSNIEFTDNQGATFNVDLTQKNSINPVLTVVSDYNATINKRKFYLDGYANDHGKRYCAVAQKVSAFPLINDALIDYLNANKNQMTTGLALAKRNFIVGEVGALVGGVTGMAAGAAKGNPLAVAGAGVGAIAGAVKTGLNYDATLQRHDAQIADLKEQARSVESVAGNNAEFDIADSNGTIMRYKWTPSKRDRERLVEYFHRHGYAVDEIQQDVSTDTMYYFDFIQCSDIIFGQEKNDKFTTLEEYIMFKECDEYIRNMYAKGVRIWHGRCPDSAQLKPQIFITPYLNTAKEY